MFVIVFSCTIDVKVPPAVVELLQAEAKETRIIKLDPDELSFNDGRNKKSHNTANTVNLLAGSDEIAVHAMLSKCITYGMYIV